MLSAPSPNRPTLVAVSKDEKSEGASVLELAARLTRDPRVAYAEPNYYLELLGLPNDPLVEKQWNLLEFGVPQAWDIETGTSSEVVVAVIDSGVYGKHEDLSGKLYPGCDFYDGDSDATPGLDTGFDAGHGTHVAGIAAATGDNGTGIAGVAYGYGVRILPVKVFDDAGTKGTVNELLDGLLWAAGIPIEGVATNPHPADIVNMSLGIDTASLADGGLKSIEEVTQRVSERGIVMFAASGNNGFDDRIFAPASASAVYAVGSVDSGGGRSAFSNYAASGATVDFMAPGGEKQDSECFSVLSTFPLNDYVCQAGTSMASPFVAGVAALLLSQNPGLSPAELGARLSDSAFFDSSYMNRKEYGNGIVCADKALGAADALRPLRFRGWKSAGNSSVAENFSILKVQAKLRVEKLLAQRTVEKLLRTSSARRTRLTEGVFFHSSHFSETLESTCRPDTCHLANLTVAGTENCLNSSYS